LRNEITNIKSTYNFDQYHILFLYDEHDNISNYHADRLYDAASKNSDKEIYLLLHSNGGLIEPAYLISKTLKRLSHGKFVVAVPRRAKSAATLIALGADEIHMGLMSQLGPIDPQLGGFPALALMNAVDYLADVGSRFPAASEMLSKYLSDKLDLRILGHFRRVSESATQYAERLLEGKALPNGRSAFDLANFLVTHYKDHGFVIDADESTSLFGEQIVKQRSVEYAFANHVFSQFDLFSLMLGFYRKKRFQLVGDESATIYISDRPKGPSSSANATLE
jgi:hypothetical protein